MTQNHLANLRWLKSSYSDGQQGNCVEVSPDLPGVVPVRDSKDTSLPALVFSRAAFATFIAGASAGFSDA